MKALGPAPSGFSSLNTCVHNERVFHFSPSDGKLSMTEAVLGEAMDYATVQLNVECGSESGRVGCCSLGERLLALVGKGEEGDDISAALIAVDDGKLNETKVHVSNLAVVGDREWDNWPALCQVSSERVLLYFGSQNYMWYCDIAGNTLTMKKLSVQMPTRGGFGAVPIPLPAGRMLVAGSDPESNDIIQISNDEEPRFSRVGTVPGSERCDTSILLIRGNFVLGFGGHNNEDLWVFDLKVRRGSLVKIEGNWHQSDFWVPLALRGDVVYLLGGWCSETVHTISLEVISRLIQDKAIRTAFRRRALLPLAPEHRFSHVLCGEYSPSRL